MNKKIIKDNIILSDILKFESVSPDNNSNLNSARNGTFKNIPTHCFEGRFGYIQPFIIETALFYKMSFSSIMCRMLTLRKQLTGFEINSPL